MKKFDMFTFQNDSTHLNVLEDLNVPESSGMFLNKSEYFGTF